MPETALQIDTANALSEEAFVSHFRQVYEHSPWIVAEAAKQRPFSSKKAMQAAMESVVFGASDDRQAQLIEAHPDLAAKLDELATLTDFSQSEQQRAGFSALPEADFERLRSRLATYREKFGHPFILCVTDHSAADTLPILEQRLKASHSAEHIACLAQIVRIGWYRLNALVS